MDTKGFYEGDKKASEKRVKWEYPE